MEANYFVVRINGRIFVLEEGILSEGVYLGNYMLSGIFVLIWDYFSGNFVRVVFSLGEKLYGGFSVTDSFNR